MEKISIPFLSRPQAPFFYIAVVGLPFLPHACCVGLKKKAQARPGVSGFAACFVGSGLIGACLVGLSPGLTYLAELAWPCSAKQRKARILLLFGFLAVYTL